MLEQLAGPFTLTFEGANCAFGSQPVWHDALGLVCAIRAPVDSLLRQAICQIDGRAHIRASKPLSVITLNLATGGLAVFRHPNFYRESDLRTLRPMGDPVDVSAYAGQVTGVWTALTDRCLWSSAGKVYAWVNGAETRTVEHTFSLAGANPGNATTSAGTDATRVFFAYTSGRIYEYDTRAQEMVGHERWVCENDWCYYSPELNVFITITLAEDETHQIRVWANEVAATSVFFPEAVGDVEPGRVVTARTLITGDHLEPCPDRVVSWSCTHGTVLDQRTTTDADGYAYTRIRLAPDEPSLTMDVTAELVQ